MTALRPAFAPRPAAPAFYVRPAGQASMMDPPVEALGVTSGGGTALRVNCEAWAALSFPEKAARVGGLRPGNLAGVVRTVDQYCARLGYAGLRPAGQAGGADLTVNPDGSSVDASGNYYDANGNLVSGSPALSGADLNAALTGGGGGGTGTAGTTGTAPPAVTPEAGLTPQQQTALFNTAGTLLNTAGTTIAAAISSGNQVEITRLQTAAATRIAELVQQERLAEAEGNQALAAQRAREADALQRLQAQLAARPPPNNTLLYVVGGVAALALAGVAYVVVAGRRGASPSRTRTRTR